METTMKIIVLGGGYGSDAGYWTIENGHLVHHGGWEAGQLIDVSRGLAILGLAARLKTPGLAEGIAREVGANVEKMLGGHLGDQTGGTVVVVNAVGF
jgi:hypothetical protein